MSSKKKKDPGSSDSWRKEEIDWEEVNAQNIKHPFAHLVQDVNSIIFFYKDEDMGEDILWFFDDIPINHPRWTIGNMPERSAIIRIKELVAEGWILAETEADELKYLVMDRLH